jgi:geranylgeranyl reductase family protein
MTEHDAIIIGAGPAGSTLARRLHQQGKRVLLIDKAEFPRNKVCAGWVTPEVLQSLDFDSAAYVASGRVLQPIHGFHVGLIGQPGVAWQESGQPVSFGIRRCEFDGWLLDQAQVDKQLGVKVKTIEQQDGLWTVNGEWRAPLLVGAGGHFCPVAAQLGDGPGSHETVVAAKELELELDAEQAAACRVGEDQPQLWFCQDLKGYAWVFRKGNFINIGLGREDNHQLTDHLHDFVHWLEAQGVIPVLGDHYHGHAYLLYDHARRPLTGDGVLLIGDAAGLAYTQSGEGIRPAIESALLAAQALAEVPDLSAASLALYERKMAARFGQRQHGKVENGDWFGLKKAIARPLMRTRWFTREVVTKRWFLHQQLPALAP